MSSPTLVQVTNEFVTPVPPGSVSVPFSSNVTGGDLLLVVAANIQTLAVPAISDTLGNN